LTTISAPAPSTGNAVTRLIVGGSGGPATQSAASLSAQSTGVGSPGSTLSTLA
jgi:hypothetical protein